MMNTTPRAEDRIQLPDGRWLAYAEFGDPEGRPVFFFHGAPGYRRNPWATQAELGSVGVRLIAPDRPGVGRSTPWPQRRLLDWPDDVQHLADTLKLGQFGVVGFSNGGPHAAVCAYKLAKRVTTTALVAPMPPFDTPGAVRQLGMPNWYYPLAQRAPWVLRTLYAGLAALAKHDPRRAERLLLGGTSQADQQLFARPELAGRFGADLAGAGGRGIADDERLMPLTWGFTLGQVTGQVRLWLGEHDQLVPPRIWLDQSSLFPVCQTTVVPDAGHFLIAERMQEIVKEIIRTT
jgi:pimeloyl-ACP methyl ester carboxylesterase